MVKLTPGNPAINEKYFKQQGLAQKIVSALIKEYDIGSWDLSGYEAEFDSATQSEIQQTVQKILDENL